ncbi:heme transporter FLVCR2-like [Cydia strobilella]|uniref:heme transporter FLVCR2-like n=1 Tax=Cydia strobilella TaxID=1100964 RepID=UPI003006645F
MESENQPLNLGKEESRAVEVDQNVLNKNNQSERKESLKVYPQRWYILALYVVYMICNSSQWLQYSIIPNAVMKFYGVTNWHVNLTSLVMMGCYLPLALPAASFMDRISLRWIAILGSSGTALGSCIKVFSATPGGFYVTLTGQAVVAVAQVLMLSVPQKLSSIWFGEREVSSACSIGVFGFQFGLVVGFFLPPILVSDHDDPNQIGDDLFKMFAYFAATSSLVAALVIFTFQAEPPLPPTLSQARARLATKSNLSLYMRTLKRIFSQRSLVALFITTGINNGCFNGLSTLLSQIFVNYFPGQEETAGNIGVTMIVFGMTASVTYGFILDKTKKFKFLLTFIYYMSAVAMAVLTALLVYCKVVWVMFAGAAVVGTFLCGFTAVSFDVATELTYPESELIIGTIMNMMSLLFTFATTLTFGYINETLGYFWGNVGFIVTLAFGATCTLPIKFELKRTLAQRTKLNEDNCEFIY